MSPQIQALLQQAVQHLQATRYVEAEPLLRKVLLQQGKNFDALFFLGVLKGMQNQHEEAGTLLRKAAQIHPQHPLVQFNLAKSLSELGREDAALPHHESAVSLSPDSPDAWMNYGNCLLKLDRLDAAIHALKKATALNPVFADAWMTLGAAQSSAEKFDEALQSFEKARALAPENFTYDYLHTKRRLCDWAGLDSAVKALRADVNHPRTTPHPLVVFALPLTPDQLKQCAELFYRALSHAQAPVQVRPLTTRARKKDRLVLAFYSSDFRNHAVGQLIVELLENIDRARFNLLAFSLTPDDGSEIRRRIVRSMDRFIDAENLSDSEVIAMSRQASVDIAVDLNGYTTGSRTAIFAARAAPVQVSYLGFPGTMGTECMDYLITDTIVCPTESAHAYTEKFAYVPRFFMPHDSQERIANTIFSRQDFSLPESAFVFCSFNAHLKIGPEVFEIWMRLLDKVPGSVLWLNDANPIVKNNLAREAMIRGIDPARLIYAPHMPTKAEHLARLRLADLFLDTFFYNAHTTACDAIWSGLPLLTCMGETFASRVAGSLLTHMGIPQLVTSTPESYEARALELALEPHQLQQIRQFMNEPARKAQALNTPELAKDIQNLFEYMYERSCAGLKPEQIELSVTEA